MSLIASIDTRLFHIPLAEVLVDAKHGDHTHFELITTTVTLKDGSQGTGYTYTGGKGGFAIAAMIERDLAPFLIGRDATEVESLYEGMQWHVHYVGRGGVASFAISALDIALWDLRGKRRGEPLRVMAGGAATTARAYCGGIDLGFPLPKLLESVRGYLARGFDGVKIKVGQPDLATDITRVAAIRKLIGPDIALMVDANYAMSVRRGDPRRPGVPPLRPDLVRRADHPGRLCRLRARRRGDRNAAGDGREPPHDPRIRPRLRHGETELHPAGFVELRRDLRVSARSRGSRENTACRSAATECRNCT